MRFRGVNGLGVGFRTVAAASALLLLAQCRKESTAPGYYVATDTTLPASGVVTHALAGTAFSFPGGAGVLSPSVAGQNMTVTFGGTAAAPTSTFALANGTVTANVTFGSCVFAVTAVSGTVGSMRVGDVITVNPCNLNVNTTGAVANGVATSRSVALLLGAAASAGATVTLAVNPGGQLTLNGNAVGSVTLTPISGDDD